MYRHVFSLFLATSMACISHAAPAQRATEPAVQLVTRMAPTALPHMDFVLAPTTTGITLEPISGKTRITAPTVRELIVGFGYYARHIAGVHWSWNGNRMNPAQWPMPTEKTSVSLPWKRNFAYNYCTLSYTSAFWGWARWEREIDMLALNGYTHVLVSAGLEKVWQSTLKELGYSDADITAFIANPAFAAWWNMGNLEGHGGPMSQALIEGEAKLGNQISTRLHQLGMTPALMGFVGLIPSNIKKYIPDADVLPQGGWCGFTRPAVISPVGKDFPRIAEIWYKHLHQVYGSKSSCYGGDLFHEGGNRGNINVTEAATAVQACMQKASPQSEWVLQCWQANPSMELLRGLDNDKCFILYLDKDLSKPANNVRSFDNKPWLWSELANFGGNNTGMYGGAHALAGLHAQLAKANAKTPNLVGLALLSEGTEQNPVYYELFHQMITSPTDVDLHKWLQDYSNRRYGLTNATLQKAWVKLADSVYKPERQQEGCTEGIVCAKPAWNAKKASTWSSGDFYYSSVAVIEAANLMLQAAKESPTLLQQETFRYDLVDTVRQVLSDFCFFALQDIKDSFDTKDIKAFNARVAQFQAALSMMDNLLASDPNTLLGVWCERALAKGKTPADKAVMLRAAKMLVTTWDSKESGLNDYSNRHWAGLVKDFYAPRWQAFFDAQRAILTGAKQPQQAMQEFNQIRQKSDLAFAQSSKLYPSKPQGDTFGIATKIMQALTPDATKLAGANVPLKGQAWDLATTPQPFTFDVSDTITAAGTYTVNVAYQAGSSALKIKSVRLFEGTKEVAADTHEGWTGVENKLNVYRLDLGKYRTGLDSYSVKIEAEGVSGPNSKGTMTIKKVR